MNNLEFKKEENIMKTDGKEITKEMLEKARRTSRSMRTASSPVRNWTPWREVKL